MAITKTSTVQRVEAYPAMDPAADPATNPAHPTVMVVYNDVIDDPDDSDLPVTATRVKHLYKFDGEGAAFDTTGEAQLVQDICGALWS